MATENVFEGRLEQGEKSPGKNAPWVWGIPTNDEVALLNEFLERYAVTAPSGSVIVDERAIAAARPEPEVF